jgi:membrane-associated phospholipid phosphatase
MLKLRILFIAFIYIGTTKSFAQNIDIDILKAINPRHPTSQYWQNTSNSAYWFSGGLIAGTLVAGFIDNNDQIKHNGYEAVLNLALDAGVQEALKVTFNRTRPSDRYPDEVFVKSPTHGKSFPSGHASLAFCTAATLSLDYHKWYITVPAYVWASSVGYSRMYLGKHYPSDVLGGAAVGMGTAYVGHWLNKQIFKQYYTRAKQPD